jgi:hypothetical protein
MGEEVGNPLDDKKFSNPDESAESVQRNDFVALRDLFLLVPSMNPEGSCLRQFKWKDKPLGSHPCCFCRLPQRENDRMIRCDGCGDVMHASCLTMNNMMIVEPYLCCFCQGSIASAFRESMAVRILPVVERLQAKLESECPISECSDDFDELWNERHELTKLISDIEALGLNMRQWSARREGSETGDSSKH